MNSILFIDLNVMHLSSQCKYIFSCLNFFIRHFFSVFTILHELIVHLNARFLTIFVILMLCCIVVMLPSLASNLVSHQILSLLLESQARFVQQLLILLQLTHHDYHGKPLKFFFFLKFSGIQFIQSMKYWLINSCWYANFLFGNRLSVSSDLKVDAERDLRDIMASKIEVYPLNKVCFGLYYCMLKLIFPNDKQIYLESKNLLSH